MKKITTFFCLLVTWASFAQEPWAYPEGGDKYYNDTSDSSNNILRMNIIFLDQGDGTYRITDTEWDEYPNSCLTDWKKAWTIDEGYHTALYGGGWKLTRLENIKFDINGDHVIRKACIPTEVDSLEVALHAISISEQIIHLPYDFESQKENLIPVSFKLNNKRALPSVYRGGILPRYDLKKNGKYFLNLGFKPEYIGKSSLIFFDYGVTHQDVGGTDLKNENGTIINNFFYNSIPNEQKASVIQTEHDVLSDSEKTKEIWSALSPQYIQSLAGQIARSTKKHQGIVLANNELIRYPSGSSNVLDSAGQSNLHLFYSTFNDYRKVNGGDSITIGAYYNSAYNANFHDYTSNFGFSSYFDSDFDANSRADLIGNSTHVEQTEDNLKSQNNGLFSHYKLNSNQDTIKTSDLIDVLTIDGINNLFNAKTYLSVVQTLRVNKNLYPDKINLLYLENFHEIHHQGYKVSFVDQQGHIVNGESSTSTGMGENTLEERSITPSPAFYQFSGLIGTLIGDGILYWGVHGIDLDSDADTLSYKVGQSSNPNHDQSIIYNGQYAPNNYYYGGYYRGHEDYLWLGTYQASKILDIIEDNEFNPIPVRAVLADSLIGWKDNTINNVKTYYPGYNAEQAFEVARYTPEKNAIYGDPSNYPGIGFGAFAMAAEQKDNPSGYVIIAFNQFNEPNNKEIIQVKLPNDEIVEVVINGQFPTVKHHGNTCISEAPRYKLTPIYESFYQKSADLGNNSESELAVVKNPIAYNLAVTNCSSGNVTWSDGYDGTSRRLELLGCGVQTVLYQATCTQDSCSPSSQLFRYKSDACNECNYLPIAKVSNNNFSINEGGSIQFTAECNNVYSGFETNIYSNAGLGSEYLISTDSFFVSPPLYHDTQYYINCAKSTCSNPGIVTVNITISSEPEDTECYYIKPYNSNLVLSPSSFTDGAQLVQQAIHQTNSSQQKWKKEELNSLAGYYKLKNNYDNDIYIRGLNSDSIIVDGPLIVDTLLDGDLRKWKIENSEVSGYNNYYLFRHYLNEGIVAAVANNSIGTSIKLAKYLSDSTLSSFTNQLFTMQIVGCNSECTVESPNISSNKNVVYQGDDVVLSTSNCNGTVKWYNSKVGGALLATANSITIENIIADSTMYASCTNSCESSRKSYLIQVTPNLDKCYRLVSKSGRTLRTLGQSDGQWIVQSDYTVNHTNSIWKQEQYGNYTKFKLDSNPNFTLGGSNNSSVDPDWPVFLKNNSSDDFALWLEIQSSSSPGWSMFANKANENVVMSVIPSGYDFNDAQIIFKTKVTTPGSGMDPQLFKKELIPCTSDCDIIAPLLKADQGKVVYNGKATITATGCGNIGTPNWYISRDATSPFYTGGVYTTESLTSPVTYYVSCKIDGTCESSKSEISISISDVSECLSLISKVSGKAVSRISSSNNSWIVQQTIDDSNNMQKWKTNGESNGYIQFISAENPSQLIRANNTSSANTDWPVYLNAYSSDPIASWKFEQSTDSLGWYYIKNEYNLNQMMTINQSSQNAENAQVKFYSNLSGTIYADGQLFQYRATTCPNVSCANNAPSISTNKSSLSPNETATLSSSNCSGTVKWYKTANGNDFISSGASLAIGPITQDSVFFASCDYNNCESNRNSIFISYFNDAPPEQCYKITSKVSGKAVKAQNVFNNAWMVQASYNSSSPDSKTIWTFTEDDGNGYEKIMSKADDSYILTNGSSAATDYYWIAHLGSDHSNDYGKWKFIESSYSSGWYRIANKKNSNLLLSVDSGNQTGEGATLKIYPDYEASYSQAYDYQLFKKESVSCPSSGAREASDNWLSIGTKEAESIINVFPNPIVDNFKINLIAKKNQKSQLFFWSSNGKELYRKSIEILKGENIIEINENVIPSNNFILGIFVDGKMMVKKMVNH